MKIELSNKKVLFKNGGIVEEIHPFWLRERVNGEDSLDKISQQRLFDPTILNIEIGIKNVKSIKTKMCKFVFYKPYLF